MLKFRNSNNYLSAGLSVVCFIMSIKIHGKFSKPIIEISKQDSAVNFDRNFLNIFSIGNNRLISNVLWIQTLIESDLEKYVEKNLNNWMYHRFRTISVLDDRFYENYLYGGMYLSIVKDDLQGAADIYERGLRFYPNDYKLNFNAGFNYYFEMGKFAEGLKRLEQIENHPELPPSIKFIINKLRFEVTNNYDSALLFLKVSIESTQDPTLQKKLKSDFYALKAERDLNCLNNSLGNCSTTDAENLPYFFSKGKWNARKIFERYKIHLKQ